MRTFLPGGSLAVPNGDEVVRLVLEELAPAFGISFQFETQLMGGCAIDATGMCLFIAFAVLDQPETFQAMLDMFTIRRVKGPDFGRLRVAIVGDILHSRVARSNMLALKTLGCPDIRVIAPRTLLPEGIDQYGVRVFNDLRVGLRDVDVVIMLRLQRERKLEEERLRQQRELVRYRRKLSQLRAGLKSQVHSVLGKEGLLPPLNYLWGPGGKTWLDETSMGEAYETRVRSLRLDRLVPGSRRCTCSATLARWK